MVDTGYLANFFRSNALTLETSDDELRQALLSAGIAEIDLPLATAFFRAGSWREAPSSPFTPSPAAAPSVAPAEVKPSPNFSTPPVISLRPHRGGLIFGLILLVIVLLGGGYLAYAYFQGMPPFGQAPYTEENIVPKIAAGFKSIQTAKQVVNVNLNLVPRDPGAKPFVPKVTSAPGRRPLLVELGQLLRLAPQNLNFGTSFTSSFKRGDGLLSSDWQTGVTFNGTFDDFNFEAELEARHVADDYYFIVNKFPSFFFLSLFSPIKGKWVHVTPEDLTATTSRSSISFFGGGEKLSQLEAEYAKRREEGVKDFELMTQLALEEKFFQILGRPTMEKVAGERLYRYQLVIDREAGVRYLKKLAEEFNKQPSETQAKYSAGLMKTVQYLESEDFIEAYKYFMDNTGLFVWADEAGLARQVEYRLRLVPPDTATQLSDKQLLITLTSRFENINEPLVVPIPEAAMPFQEALKLFNPFGLFGEAEEG